MSNQMMVIFLAVITILWFALGFVIFKKNNKAEKQFNYGRKKNPFAYILYKWLSTFPLTKRYYGKVVRRHKMLYPGDDLSIMRRVTKQFVSAGAAALAVMVVFIILGQGNLFFIAFGIWTTMVIFTLIISSTFKHMESKLLEQTKNMLKLTKEKFHNEKIIQTALYLCIDEVPTEIRVHLQKIYNITVATDSELEVEKYVPVAPNKFLTTFAAICSSIKEYGDKEVNGRGLFEANVNYLIDEVNAEILKNKKKSFLYSGLIVVALAPVFLIKLAEIGMSYILPETASYYNGAGGTISVIAVFIVSYVCYQIIETLRNDGVDEVKEYTAIQNLSKVPIVQQLLDAIENHNYSKTLRIGDKLKMTGNKMGTRAYLLSRFLIAIGCVFLVNVLAFVVVGNQKNDLLTNFTTAFENSVVPNDDYRIIMQEAAKEYAANYKYVTSTDPEEQADILAKYIAAEKGIKPRYAKDIATSVIEHTQEAFNVYYKWWMLLISFGAGIIGFYAPLFILDYKVKISNMNMEDEVIQFQTIVIILMYQDGVTINVILKWLERFAFIFKDSIRKCIINMELNQQESLKKLRESESFEPFKNFVSQLIASDDTKIAEAFSSIDNDREYYRDKRKQDNEEILAKKSSNAYMAAFVPYGVFLALYVIVPFSIYIYNMFQTTSILLG